MNFVLSEAEENTTNLHFSDDKLEDDHGDSSFIDDAPIDQESIHFYRDLTESHYPKFENQTRDPTEATYSDISSFFGEDEQPELYDPENRDHVEFDRFDKFEQSINRFQKSLLRFANVDNYFFILLFTGLCTINLKQKVT